MKKILVDNQHLSINQILQKIINEYSGIDSQIKKDIKKNIKKYVKRMINQREEEIIGIKNIEECMKMIIKDIKKSKEYKDLPKNISKSKLNKKKLCEAINKN